MINKLDVMDKSEKPTKTFLLELMKQIRKLKVFLISYGYKFPNSFNTKIVFYVLSL